MDNLTPFWASLALTQMLDGDVEAAEVWLRKLPRADRGALKKGLDDLDMMLSRLGNN